MPVAVQFRRDLSHPSPVLPKLFIDILFFSANSTVQILIPPSLSKFSAWNVKYALSFTSTL